MSKSTAQQLEAAIPRIMNLWVERADKEIRASKHQETLALKNSLPEYLQQLSDALSKIIDRNQARTAFDKSESTRIGKKHGHERAKSEKYTMDQMIMEYHILRQVIFDVLETDKPLDPIDREIIICSIEQAVNDAATQFSDSLRALQEKLANALVHDLRTPLSAAKINAQLILKNSDSHPAGEKATKIVTNLNRIDGMITDLLNVSRNKAGEKPLIEKKETDLDQLVRSVAQELSLTHKAKIKIISKEKCIGIWNEDSLRRLIENLVTNGIKYGKPKTPVTIFLIQNKQYAEIKIHNHGNPIPLNEQKELFKQFKRASTVEGKEGWGLGLSVVKDVTRMHHGKIKIESNSKSGTSFIIILPKKPLTKKKVAPRKAKAK